jgi:hypothetical protein
MKKLVLGLISVLVLAYATLLGWDRWVNARRIMAGPGNESSLYQSYDPEQVIREFRYGSESYGSGNGNGALHLIKSIKHNREFIPRFTMQANREQELLIALRKDIVLHLTGMTVVATHDDPDGSFIYKYTSGNSVGSISVQAPVHHMTVPRYPVPSGLDDVALNIVLEETWSRPASESQLWMAAVD